MSEQKLVLFRLYQMGFEPMQLALADLETASLDHSDTDTKGFPPAFLTFLYTRHLESCTG